MRLATELSGNYGFILALAFSALLQRNEALQCYVCNDIPPDVTCIKHNTTTLAKYVKTCAADENLCYMFKRMGDNAYDPDRSIVTFERKCMKAPAAPKGRPCPIDNDGEKCYCDKDLCNFDLIHEVLPRHTLPPDSHRTIAPYNHSRYFSAAESTQIQTGLFCLVFLIGQAVRLLTM